MFNSTEQTLRDQSWNAAGPDQPNRLTLKGPDSYTKPIAGGQWEEFSTGKNEMKLPTLAILRRNGRGNVKSLGDNTKTWKAGRKEEGRMRRERAGKAGEMIGFGHETWEVLKKFGPGWVSLDRPRVPTNTYRFLLDERRLKSEVFLVCWV